MRYWFYLSEIVRKTSVRIHNIYKIQILQILVTIITNQRELTNQEKSIQQVEQNKKTKSWVNDDQIFEKWKKYPSDGCYLQVANIKKTQIREGYWIPCGKPDVMGLKIPAGTRGGARRCGATWAAAGGIYYQGTTERAYCTRCWYAYCLTQGIDVQQILKELKMER